MNMQESPEELPYRKQKLFYYFKYLTDGIQYYPGTQLSQVHANLGITDEQFDRVVGKMTTCLRKMRPKLKVFQQFSRRISDLRD